MFFIGRFILTWIIWFVLADKKRWRELFVAAMLAALLGHLTDTMMKFYELWNYQTKGHLGLDQAFLDILDDIGIYVVVTYLFIQYFPKQKTPFNIIKYWTIWVALAIVIEWVHLVTGHMTHHKWWSLGWSALSDVISFYVFYKFHQVFHLEKLSPPKKGRFDDPHIE